MSVTAVFQELDQQLHKLREALLALRTTVCEDYPQPGDHVLVERLGDSIEDLLGNVNELQTALRHAQPVDCQVVEWERLCQALVACQSGHNQVFRRYWSELAAYEQIAGLLRLGRERGGEWRPWSASVYQGLAYCQQPLFALNEALFHSWREIANRH
jgi:hypothetical protein